MMQRWIARFALVTITFAMGGVPQMAQAWQQQPAQDQTQQQPSTENPQQKPGNATVDPSAAPLEPPASQEPQTLPNAPSATNPQSAAPPQNQQSSQPAPQATPQPAGTAAATAAPTYGGAASKPAGIAIAPAKQRQVRSLLIKLGALAAAGVAIGTVYALSKGSPSNPPGSK